MAARAALDAARVVFAPLTADAAGLSSVEDAPDVTAWPAAARVLQACTGRADLDGQALVGEARRVGLLSLESAYVLVALHSSPTDRPTGDAVVRALEHAVDALDASSLAQPGLIGSESFSGSARFTGTEPLIGSEAREGARGTDRGSDRERARSAPLQARSDARISSPNTIEVIPRRVSLSAGFILGTLVLIMIGAAGAWYAMTPRALADDYAQGVEAYQRGAREVARLAFARAAKARPDDAGAFVFLGRLAREDGNLPAARRFLDAAIRLAPGNATANREMASVLLADGSTDVARRFYVRALQLDPTDRLAQGFLACALARLGRVEEAQRWSERAGPGDWSSCVSSPASSATNADTNTSASHVHAAPLRSGAAPAATIPSTARP
jgi:hypothetical protein